MGANRGRGRGGAEGRRYTGVAGSEFEFALGQLGGDGEGGAFGEGGEVEHEVGHDAFHDGAEAAGAEVVFHGAVDDEVEGLGRDVEGDIVHAEKLLVLFHQGVLGFGEDAAQGVAVEGLEGGEHGEAAHEFGDEAEFLEVHGLDILEHVVAVELGTGLVAFEADDVGIESRGDGPLDAVEGAAADEEDVACVDGDEFLLGMFASSLWGDGDEGALEEFQQGLLHAFAADVACDGGVLALAGDLVDLVDEDDAALAGCHVVVGGLEEAHEDVLDVVAHIAGLGQRGGVGDAEGYLEKPCDGACQKGFAGAGLANHDDVAFLDLDIVLVAMLGVVFQAFVVVVDGHGEHALRHVLPDDVLVEEVLDFDGFGDVGALDFEFLVLRAAVLFENEAGLGGAVLADVAVEARKEHAGLRGGTAAKGAVLFVGGFLGHL